MMCRRCRTENPDDSRFCSKCGALLAPKPASSRRTPPWYALLAGGLTLLAAGLFLSRLVFQSREADVTRGASSESERSAPAAVPGPKDASPGSGILIVQSLSGRENSRWPAALFEDAWAALPAWALLNGANLSWVGTGRDPVPMEWAVWTEGEPVVLCRMEGGPGGRTPRLSRWRPDVQLRWLSLEHGRSVDLLGQPSGARNGSYLACPLPAEIRGPGLFLQEEVVVGWTFGPGREKGYLWAGTGEVDSAPRIRLSELCGSVLSGSREARFGRVLALGEGAPAPARLAGFVEAFRAAPVFEEDDIPAELRPAGVVTRMHALAAELTQAGAASDVIRALDDSTLIETESTALLKDVVLARVKARGYEAAILELTRLEKHIFDGREALAAELRPFQAQLYASWLKEILEKRGAGGLEAFEKAKLAFPDDVEIHLLGIEIAIMEKSWARASEFLEMRQYPDALAARTKMLENLIQEGQQDEGVAVLRFDPGTDHIPVEAYVNNKVILKFIIDTGATTSLIPASAVEALGLKLDEANAKPIVIEGIAGRGITLEVTLETVELAGLRVHNVKASIADIASYKDTGILGQNFLSNFQLDIDYKKGILRIRKR